MKLGKHLPDGERRKPIDNEVCRTKVKVTTITDFSIIDEMSVVLRVSYFYIFGLEFVVC